MTTHKRRLELTRLLPEHYRTLAPYFARQRFSHSSYGLSYIISYRNVGGYDVEWAIDGDAVILVARHRATPAKDYLALPVPAERYGPAELARLADELELRELPFVPEAYLDEVSREALLRDFSLDEQPMYEDYLYRTEDLALLPGRDYAKKRNLIKQFEREFVDEGRVRVEKVTAEVAPLCCAFADEWRALLPRDDQDPALLDDDRTFTCNAFHDFFDLELDGITVHVDGVLRGLGVATRISDDVGVLCIEKAHPELKGLYQFLDRECARQLFAGRYAFINKESDMDVPGLRQSKRSYHPVARIKTFKLTRLVDKI